MYKYAEKPNKNASTSRALHTVFFNIPIPGADDVIETMREIPSNPANRPVDIHISEDLMSADVDLYPPVEGEPGLTIDVLIARLEPPV